MTKVCNEAMSDEAKYHADVVWQTPQPVFAKVVGTTPSDEGCPD